MLYKLVLFFAVALTATALDDNATEAQPSISDITATTFTSPEDKNDSSTTLAATAGTTFVATAVTTSAATTGTTLGAAATTLAAIPVRNKTSRTPAPVNGTCYRLKPCFDDSDCMTNGPRKGRCLGENIGKCNCRGCITFWKCDSDEACGGLRGGCNATTKVCKCIEALWTHGYPTFTDAARELCNVKDCTRHSDTCHGLACTHGRCVC